MIARDGWRVAFTSMAFAGVCFVQLPESSAAPSVWASARRPHAAAREMLSDQSEKVLVDSALEKRRVQSDTSLFLENDEGAVSGKIEARELLEQAGGATSPNMTVRLRYASLLRTLASEQKPQNHKNLEEAGRILRTVLASQPAPSVALNAWNELALSYAVLGQREKEIQAYGEALNLESVGAFRSMLLANRAESYMGLGRLDDAIQGYRESLASLVFEELDNYGVTTLWGLAVAVDRNGDLEDGLEKIRLARKYDTIDSRINSSGWFYSPPYDEHWYKALGSWVKARSEPNSIDRTFEYGHAIEAWDRYIDRATANDPYVSLAKVRRRMCDLERERAANTTVKH
jgi:tetratricopeptide (TPR) repeat protein